MERDRDGEKSKEYVRKNRRGTTPNTQYRKHTQSPAPISYC